MVPIGRLAGCHVHTIHVLKVAMQIHGVAYHEKMKLVQTTLWKVMVVSKQIETTYYVSKEATKRNLKEFFGMLRDKC